MISKPIPLRTSLIFVRDRFESIFDTVQVGAGQRIFDLTFRIVFVHEIARAFKLSICKEAFACAYRAACCAVRLSRLIFIYPPSR